MLKSRFGHHALPATDFRKEVEKLESMAKDRRCGAAHHANLEMRVRAAMEFVVSGDAGAIAAKNRLRVIDAQLSREAELA